MLFLALFASLNPVHYSVWQVVDIKSYSSAPFQLSPGPFNTQLNYHLCHLCWFSCVNRLILHNSHPFAPCWCRMEWKCISLLLNTNYTRADGDDVDVGDDDDDVDVDADDQGCKAGLWGDQVILQVEMLHDPWCSFCVWQGISIHPIGPSWIEGERRRKIFWFLFIFFARHLPRRSHNCKSSYMYVHCSLYLNLQLNVT